MTILYGAVAVLVAIILVLMAATVFQASAIGRRNPPVGQFVDIDGTRIHYVHVAASSGADLPPVVFIHGASANLKDQMVPLRPLLESRAELLFFDRPGYGWSERGKDHETPEGQAELVSRLMEKIGISRAVIVAHSFGGSIAAAFAIAHPKNTAGLVFMSAATHPWLGGKTSWYYELAARPGIGWLFSSTLTTLAGAARMPDATLCVFAPNPMPENYLTRASIELVLRPSTFRANAVDVQSLYAYATKNAGRYKTITAPTVVISGDADTVVYEEIHSLGLARDIPGAELTWVKNLGHKSDWIASDLVVAAIEKVSGKPADVQAAAKKVEARIAADRSGEGVCVNEKAPEAELSPP